MFNFKFQFEPKRKWFSNSNRTEPNQFKQFSWKYMQKNDFKTTFISSKNIIKELALPRVKIVRRELVI